MENILNYLEITTGKHPQKVAVEDGDMVLCWSELLELSRRMGSGLCGLAEKGSPIVLLMEKSAMTLAAMFGIVYAGCFYILVDPSQPKARIQKILEIVNPKVCVVNDETEQKLQGVEFEGYPCKISTLMKNRIQEEKLQSIRKESEGSDLLYGIFTSGSTGVPKCIVVNHKAVIDFIGHFTKMFRITEQDCIGNQAPFDFDVSVKDIYSSVMTGAKLVLIKKEFFAMPRLLLDDLIDKKVTVLTWAVSALTTVSALKGLSYRKPKMVRIILFSGEVMPQKHLERWMNALPQTEFVNLYGPSEITCNCTFHKVNRAYEYDGKLPIGISFPGREVFLIDENGREVMEQDSIGEICVAGESLADGYYHNPGETDKHFYKCPQRGLKRCYKTGDLGYYGEGRNLYFAGRRDFQIKHMGHRIELEEIEQKVENLQGVERCCCLMDEKRNRIVAFYQGETGTEEIRNGLKTMVPGYMIPQKLVKTEIVPLNKNGKTDRTYFRKKLEVIHE